jgi:hypothetical protein
MSDDRMAEGVEHLQAAALEVIEAARAFLDVAEELITDPDRVSGTLATVATLVDGAGRSARRRSRASTADEPQAAEKSSRLRRIDLS